VASIPEIELVAEHAPGRAHGLHASGQEPQAITAAYFDHGVRTFSLDTHEELAKILDAPAAPRT
jgi:ornithine decarboxylase